MMFTANLTIVSTFLFRPPRKHGSYRQDMRDDGPPRRLVQGQREVQVIRTAQRAPGGYGQWSVKLNYIL